MRFFFIFLFTLTCIFSVSAQADIELTLTDMASSEPLKGFEVVLSNGNIGSVWLDTTNEMGRARFEALPIIGEYIIWIDASDKYQEERVENIILRSNANRSVRIALPRKTEIGLPEVVIGGNRSSKINTINAEVSSEISLLELENIPVEGRDVTRALYRLPNVTQATGFYPEAPNISINGANSLFTNYLIDGMDNNENFLGGQRFPIPVGFTENVSVLSNNYSAQYGLTGNGVINITSRSGGHETSGEVFYVSRPGPALDAASPYPQRDLSGNLVKDGFMRNQFGIGVGGPIRQHKTYYYLNIEQTFDRKDNLLNSPELDVFATLRGRNSFTYLSGKIDHFWSKKMQSSIRINAGFTEIENQGGGLEGGVAFPSNANTKRRNALSVASKNIFLGNNFSSESNLQYARFYWNYTDPVNAGQPSVTALDPNELPLAILGPPDFVFREVENTFEFQQKLSWYLNHHVIRVGFNIKSSSFDLEGGGNQDGYYLAKLNQQQIDDLVEANYGTSLDPYDLPAEAQVLQYHVELRPASFGATQNIYSIYAEDEISFNNRLTFSLGLRYDYDNLSKGGADKGDFNNLAPRVSINYSLNNSSSIRAGYGIFYEKIIYAVYSDALQQSSTSKDFRKQLEMLIDQGILPGNTDFNKILFDGNIRATFPGVEYLQGPSSEELQGMREETFSNELRILSPDAYQNPYTHQFMLGYQFQADDDKLFYIDIVHTRSHNLIRLRDLNAPSVWPVNDPYAVDVRSQAGADSTRPVPVYSDSKGYYTLADDDTLRGFARNVVVSESAGRANYYGISLNYQKDRGDDNFAYRLIYTLSFLENNTEDINFRAKDANNFDDEWGPSINDRRHVLNAIFHYYPILNLRLSLAALLQSGQPINRIPDATIYGTTDLNGDGRSYSDAYTGNNDRSPGESRNSDRLPWSNVFDLGVEYVFKIGKKGWLEASADVFNIFNAVNLSGYSNNATQSNQIQVGPAASGSIVRKNAGPPRQFQFGLRYLF